MELQRKKRKLSPPQVLIAGFAAIILLGGILLSTPWVTKSGESIGFLNGLFTSTTSVCVTGLVVVDTGTTFNTLGLGIIIALIQAGGLGFMTLASALFLMLRRRITLKERLVIGEAFNTSGSLQGMVRLVKRAITLTLTVEGIGAVLLCFRMVPMFGWTKGLGMAAFLSVSAFCNAGIDPLGGFASLTGFLWDPLMNFTIMALIIIGGLGFAVITDIWECLKDHKRWNVNTKAVVGVTGALLIGGAVLFCFLEWNNPKTMGDLPVGQKLMAGIFQSVTPRTAGFNTISQLDLTVASKVLTMLLMFIGASPASTGGGIKTTTFLVLVAAVVSIIRGREDTVLFCRRISRDVVRRAAAVTVIAMSIVLIITCVICTLEAGDMPIMTLDNILMETFSAMGTVGLSCGITPYLHPISKILLIITMFFGRLGPLTIAIGLAGRKRPDEGIRYPEGKIMVG